VREDGKDGVEEGAVLAVVAAGVQCCLVLVVVSTVSLLVVVPVLHAVDVCDVRVSSWNELVKGMGGPRVGAEEGSEFEGQTAMWGVMFLPRSFLRFL
jgi:hypothetical protein